LQYVGTDLIRAKYPNYWIDALMRAIVILEQYDYFIIPDTRFYNEILVPSSAGFDVRTVLITRPDHVSTLTEEQQRHPSETGLDDFEFDYVVVGGEGREGVYQPVVKVLNDIIGV